MIYTHLAAALLAAAMAFTGAWNIQSGRFAKKELEHATQQIALEREVRIMDSKRTANVIDAQNSARQRDVALRRGADSARSELDGLRAQSTAALFAGRASHQACIERADAFSLVLNQCSSEYQALGAIADRHASDVQTLSDAWPK